MRKPIGRAASGGPYPSGGFGAGVELPDDAYLWALDTDRSGEVCLRTLARSMDSGAVSRLVP
ncbi:MAG: hypothetical protein ACR2HA_08775 [Nocardioides sp.]